MQAVIRPWHFAVLIVTAILLFVVTNREPAQQAISQAVAKLQEDSPGDEKGRPITPMPATPEKSASKPPAETRETAPALIRQPPKKFIKNSCGLELVLVTAGAFLTTGQLAGQEEYLCQVSVARPFYLQRDKVTHAQWREVMGENHDSFTSDDAPLEAVSWREAGEFIRRLNEKEGGEFYGLPSRAEWLYAAQEGVGMIAGAAGFEIPGGGARPSETENGQPAQYSSVELPNLFGLHGMHKPPAEWARAGSTEDMGQESEPVAGQATSLQALICGGDQLGPKPPCRVAPTNQSSPHEPIVLAGLRLVRKYTPDQGPDHGEDLRESLAWDMASHLAPPTGDILADYPIAPTLSSVYQGPGAGGQTGRDDLPRLARESLAAQDWETAAAHVQALEQASRDARTLEALRRLLPRATAGQQTTSQPAPQPASSNGLAITDLGVAAQNGQLVLRFRLTKQADYAGASEVSLAAFANGVRPGNTLTETRPPEFISQTDHAAEDRRGIRITTRVGQEIAIHFRLANFTYNNVVIFVFSPEGESLLKTMVRLARQGPSDAYIIKPSS